MISQKLACRILYCYYTAMAFMWIRHPEDMMNNFDFMETTNETAACMGGWAGAFMAITGCMLMAAAQLDCAAQKKILQYHSAGMLCCIYMTQKYKSLIKDTAPLNGNVGLVLCISMFALSIYPCYYGPDAKAKSA